MWLACEHICIPGCRFSPLKISYTHIPFPANLVTWLFSVYLQKVKSCLCVVGITKVSLVWVIHKTGLFCAMFKVLVLSDKFHVDGITLW